MVQITDADVTQADREMLAVEYERDGLDGWATVARRGSVVRRGPGDIVTERCSLRAIAAARIAATPKPKMPCGVPGGCDEPARCVSEGQCHYGWSPARDRVATVAGILERARNTFRVNDSEYQEWEINKIARTIVAGEARPAPIDMILHCPVCHEQHVDASKGDWTNPPHRSHLCHKCGTIWRPADIETNGVAAIKTKGNKDGEARGYDTAPPVAPAPNEAPAFTAEMSELLECLALQVRWLMERRQSSDGDTRAMTIEVMTERAFPSEKKEAP